MRYVFEYAIKNARLVIPAGWHGIMLLMWSKLSNPYVKITGDSEFTKGCGQWLVKKCERHAESFKDLGEQMIDVAKSFCNYNY